MTGFGWVAHAVLCVWAGLATAGAGPVATHLVSARPTFAPAMEAGPAPHLVAGGVAYLPLARRSTRPIVVGAIHTEKASQVEVTGDRAYVLVDAHRPGMARVLVIDVSDPSRPTRVGATEALPLPARSIVAEGDRLYVLGCQVSTSDWGCHGSIQVYSAAGSAVPELLASWRLPFGLRQPVSDGAPTASWMAASGTTVYVATGEEAPEATVRILDAADPKHIREAGRIALSGRAHYVTHNDGFLYLTGTGVTTMTIADVRDPSRPHVVASVPVLGTASQIAPVLVAVHGGTAYALTGVGDYGPSGVRAFDVSEPSHPRLVGETLVRILGPYAATATADRLYVVDGYRVGVFDVRRPGAPVPLQRQDSLSAADIAVCERDGTVFVADERTALLAFASPDLGPPTGLLATLGETSAAAARDGRAYVASKNGLWVIDVGNAAAPRPIRRVAEVGSIAWVKEDRESLLVLGRDANTGSVWLQSLALGEPDAPELIGRLRLSMLDDPYGDRFDIADGILWMAHRSSTGGTDLASYDIRDLSGPRPLGTMSFAAEIRALALRGDRAYVALHDRRGDSLAVVDIGDPARPSHLGTSEVSTCLAHAVAAAGELVAIGGDRVGSGCVLVYDVSVPEAPRLVGSVATRPVTSLRFDGDVLWSTSSYVGDSIEAIGVSDPARPTVFGMTGFEATAKLAPAPGPVMVTGDGVRGYGVGLQVLALP